jgi:hypothetical protein
MNNRQNRRLVPSGLLAGIFLVALLLSFVEAWATNSVKNRLNMETKTLMINVLEIMKTRPLTLQEIEKAFHVRLAPDAQNTNDHTLFYSASAKDSQLGLDSIEVRFPTRAAPPQQRMLILSLNPTCGLTEAEVREQLGEPNSLQVGSPAAPEGTSYIYRMKMGALRFGILRDPKDHIGTIVIAWEE